MINSRYLIAFFALSLFACYTKGDEKLSWKHNGRISDAKGNSIQLSMQNLYNGQEYDKGLFVIGYRIDKLGINHPTAARISSQLTNPEYWSFENDLQGFFIYQQSLFINDSKGDVYSFNGSQWHLSEIKLKPNSTVVFSAGDLIACYPSSLFKESNQIGVCFSMGKGW